MVLEYGDHLWTSSNRGIARLPIGDVEAVMAGRATHVQSFVLGREDGLRSLECNGGNEPASLATRDGRLLFPTLDGVASIDPAAFATASPPPRVLIERATVDDRAISVTDGRVSLAAGARRLSISFTAPALRSAEQLAFQYRLVGFDDGWITAGPQRDAIYTSLPPGDYQFEVRTRGRSPIWSEPARVVVAAAPQLYQALWFRVVIACSLVLLLAGAYLTRVRRLELRRLELQRLVDERTHSLVSAQADLVRAERMASVSQLVGGIAHELNNPIGFIASNVAPLRRYCDHLSRVSDELTRRMELTATEREELTRLTPGKSLEYVVRDLAALVADVEEGARRAVLIVGDLQRMTGRERGLEEVDLARAVRRSAALLGHKLEGKPIVLVLELEPVPPLSARAGQLEQVVVNLLDNAIHAVNRRGGRIRVSLCHVADRLELAIEDDGGGMAEDVRVRAFDPFFTTKPPGEGSGLGLAIASAIVTEHGGDIAIDSAPGTGTVVRIHLPLLSPTGSAQANPQVSESN